MKKLLSLALLAMMAMGAHAQEQKDSADNKKPVFTTIKELPITSIKDQNRSGTCWAYSTLSFFESEILKKTGKTYDLCEMFIANKDYMERAEPDRSHAWRQPVLTGRKRRRRAHHHEEPRHSARDGNASAWYHAGRLAG